MSDFITAFNFGNTDFGVSCAETFQLVRNGTTGTYTAISIDDLEGASAVNPGGLRGDYTCQLFVKRTVCDAMGIIETGGKLKDGAILIVRTKRVRIMTMNDEGDDTIVLGCKSAGVRIS
jgi:hypothetical protein